MEVSKVAFEITYEAVEMMRNLAKKIPNSVDAIHQSNVEVIKCYESVRNTLGPHTRKIEAIVCDIEKLLKKNAEYFTIASNALNQQADRAQRILDMKYKFKNDLKVDVMPTVSTSNGESNSSGSPTIGARIRKKSNEMEYEH